jgi:dUTP pyrophosphatase
MVFYTLLFTVLIIFIFLNEKIIFLIKLCEKDIKFIYYNNIMALIGNLFTYFFCGTGVYYIYKILHEFNRKKLYIQLNDENAKLPRVGSKYAAGYDLYSCDEGIIKSNTMGKINIGISLIIPYDHYGRIAPRSGLTLNYSLNVGAGVIDSDYRGNISVILFNHGNKDFKYNIGDRVSQLIIEKISHCDIVNVTEIDDTDRGDGGFGSTGISNNNLVSKYNDDETVDEETVDEETVDEETVDEETVDEETVDEETVDEETVDEETVDEETVDEETVDEETVDEETVDEETVDEETVDEETVDEETVDEETVDEETVDEETVDEETVDEETNVTTKSRSHETFSNEEDSDEELTNETTISSEDQDYVQLN